ncbi:cytochrome P450 [Micromonospora sp. WMMD1102]|uniref:cytochrome P450 n=1 Tax=Micromonospora sp. WMMD1102 TaxID=3016105 RepID=UPI002414F4FD|nr:cytochrome P450 [Micromonospora sp. WMMD1102]MDG4791460.1 cytochrome P450 [Micromonospora sp. WMMD1102]
MARSTVPGPRGRWLVGDVTAYQRDRIGWLTRSRAEYGDLVRLSPQVVVVHDAELGHEVLVATNDSYTVDNGFRASKRHLAAQDARIGGWMSVRRDVWKAIADRITETHMHRFVGMLTEDLATRSNGPVDVVEASRAMLGRAIVDFCLGGDETERQGLTTLCAAADDLFLAAVRSLVGGEGRVGWWPRPAARAAVAANERLLALLGGIVRRRHAGSGPPQPRDLLDGLLVGARSEVDLDRVVSVLRTIMFASHGVPGAAMSWIALLLAEHPDVAERVAAEARQAPLTATTPLPYTSAVIQEAVRLYPPQWMITRTARRPVELAGHRLAAGTEVLICPYLIHRDPRWWSDPERFDPERWLGRERPHARHAYLPFGAGPRICPGSRLATVQLAAVTAVLARDYRLDLPPLASVTPVADGLLLPAALTGGWHPVATAPA